MEDIDFAAANAYERKFRHDVMAHVHAFGDVCPAARPIIHLGATSCSITDNADLLVLREALQMIAQRLAAEDPADNSFTSRLAALFCAEAVTNTLNRLRTRPADFGLAIADIHALEQEATAATFLPRQLGAANIASLGRTVLERDGDLGPDLLGEHHSMMRDTFRRFADDVVAPLAETVHREDLIIPDAILEPLKDMGMFGLSIPASYGGLQEDDREDTLGMIVVVTRASAALIQTPSRTISSLDSSPGANSSSHGARSCPSVIARSSPHSCARRLRGAHGPKTMAHGALGVHGPSFSRGLGFGGR